MNIGRTLLSLPLRRQTVVGALIMTTILFIVYQFTFVAELNESSKPQKHDVRAPKRQSDEEDIIKHPRDTRLKDSEISNKAEDTGGDKENDNNQRINGNQLSPPKYIEKEHEIPNDKAQVMEESKGSINKINSAWNPKLNQPEDKEKLGKELNVAGKFRCEKSGKVISIEKVNDDYCDCPEDGSDEPRTNACANGRFNCKKHTRSFPASIPSGWVNDGVCDCCDGSDEWKMKKTEANLPLNLQKKLGRFVTPCMDQCPDAT